METFYLVCAVLGGTLLVGQFLLSLLGIGGDHGVDSPEGDLGADGHEGHGDHGPSDAGGAWFLSLLTLKTITAGLTFFGIAGLAGTASNWDDGLTLLLALLCGGSALYGVAMMMKGLMKLQADGTVRIQRAIGTTGTVYLTIPAAGKGRGKVTLNLQGRTVEYQAITNGEESLATGTPIQVIGVIDAQIVEVTRATVESPTHV